MKKLTNEDLEKAVKTFLNIPDGVEGELGYYKQRCRDLEILLQSERDKSAYRCTISYEKGWKDATKKINNFIQRHCCKYENEIDEEVQCLKS